MNANSNKILNIVEGLLVEAKISKTKRNKVYSEKDFKGPSSSIPAPVTKTEDQGKLITRNNVESILDGYGAGFITKHLDDSHYEALSKMPVDQLRDAAHAFKSTWVAANFPDVTHVSANDLSSRGLQQGKEFDILSKSLESGTHGGETSTDDEGNMLILRKGVPLSLDAPELSGDAYQKQMAFVRPSKTAHPFDKNPRIKVDQKKIDAYVEKQYQPGATSSVERIVKNKPGYGTRIAAGVGGAVPEAGSELPEDKGVHPVMVYANILRDKVMRANNPKTNIANPEELRVRETDASLEASRDEEQLEGEWRGTMMHRLVPAKNAADQIQRRKLSSDEKSVRRAIKISNAKDTQNMDIDSFERSNAIKTAHTVALTAKDEPIDPIPQKEKITPLKAGYPSWAKLVTKKV